MAPKLDTVIIASGDGDFIPLVEYLQMNEGCQVEVISFGKSSSAKLKEVADDFIDMCENPKKYLINYFPSSTRNRRPRKDDPKDEGASDVVNTNDSVDETF